LSSEVLSRPFLASTNGGAYYDETQRREPPTPGTITYTLTSGRYTHTYLRTQDQPLLRLPHELLRKNFKTVQKDVEVEQKDILSALKATANASLAGGDTKTSAKVLDKMIERMQSLKRKMEDLHEEEKVLHQNSRKRIQHLQDLYEIPSLADVKYDEWSKIRLNRLLVDYLLRSGYGESARALAREKGIEELVDLDIFVQCHKIEESLRYRDTYECLKWYSEHKPMMKKMHVGNTQAVKS
jgi:macrophage erythroblast attacher